MDGKYVIHLIFDAENDDQAHAFADAVRGMAQLDREISDARVLVMQMKWHQDRGT